MANEMAGPWTATYDGNALGEIDDSGFSADVIYGGEEFGGDSHGDSITDGVYRGGNCFVSFVLMNFNATAVKELLFPFGGAIATVADLGKVGTLGVLHSSLAKSLTLTPVAGTTAAAIYASIDFNKTLIAPNQPITIPMLTRLTRIPVRMRAFKYDDSGTARWFKPVAA